MTRPHDRGHQFRVNDEITLAQPRPDDPFFIQNQRTVRVLEVIGDQVRVVHWPAHDNRQEYVMDAVRFKPAERLSRR